MNEEHGTALLRTALVELVDAGPPVGFTGPDLLRAGRRRRRTRLGLLLSAAACGVAVAVVVPAVVLGGRTGSLPAGGSRPATAPAVSAPVPSGTPAPRPFEPIGLSAAEAKRLARCMEMFRAVRPGPLRVYNVLRDSLGTVFLLYGPTSNATCEPDYSGLGPMPGPPMSSSWLPGPVVVDTQAAASALDPKHSSKVAYDIVAGRVGAAVSRVVVSLDGRSATAAPLNGTFLVRLRFPADWKADVSAKPEVRAYDAVGRLLGDSADVLGKCYATPDGTVIYPPVQAGGAAGCDPAVRWP
jgi:hypothetical protein